MPHEEVEMEVSKHNWVEKLRPLRESPDVSNAGRKDAEAKDINNIIFILVHSA